MVVMRYFCSKCNHVDIVTKRLICVLHVHACTYSFSCKLYSNFVSGKDISFYEGQEEVVHFLLDGAYIFRSEWCCLSLKVIKKTHSDNATIHPIKQSLSITPLSTNLTLTHPYFYCPLPNISPSYNPTLWPLPILTNPPCIL